MAGDLRALLLKPTAQSPGATALPTVPLSADSGLSLLPLTDETMANVMSAGPEDSCVDGFYELRTGVAEWARRRFHFGDVAYVHMEFFGGHGFHAAMAWRAGSVAWGPSFTETTAGEAEPHYTVTPAIRDMAINALLRWWGIQPTGQDDEFAAAGVDRHRSTKAWSRSCGPRPLDR
ncbi:hypothetical protein [Paractinoplanes atraurantiacus]|uniref:Uncharacterized protein n=1 Tax=Paractinoplanes atraurantiacus TaxID=1036182 RepID=A0A285IYG6_9ACTN|nr:hypothetical protein [Actinoplanes atraurantiacus]SNY53024.1 hypothetical protein SAMN05421748_113160 [Actinoplanes atraurantiacus]